MPRPGRDVAWQLPAPRSRDVLGQLPNNCFVGCSINRFDTPRLESIFVRLLKKTLAAVYQVALTGNVAGIFARQVNCRRAGFLPRTAAC